MTDDRRNAAEPSGGDENFEPYELHGKMPWALIAFAVGLGLWGAGTLLDTREDVAAETPARIAAMQQSPDVAPDPGAALFEARCSTCHQSDGAGVRGAIPPLAESPFVAQGPEVVARIVLRGIDGPIRVNEHLFNGHMPSFASVLTDGEITRLANHVSERFGMTDAKLEGSAIETLRTEVAESGSFKGGAEVAASTGLSFGEQPEFVAASEAPLSPEVSSLIFAEGGGQWACASCHGDLGQGTENTPRLAGLPAAYIVKQLADFSSGARQNESMRLVVASLSDDDKQRLGDYYADLRVPSNSVPTLGGDLARGEELALRGDWSQGVPACFSCHGPSGFGVAPQFPPLAAQHAAYTAGQLAAWSGDQRSNSPLDLMRRISLALKDSDRRAVADYLASLPPVPAGDETQVANVGERP